MKPIPKISTNDPLKIEAEKVEYQESGTEKRGKLIFGLGVLFFVGVVMSTFALYFFWSRLV